MVIYSRTQPFLSKIKERQLLTKENSTKKTYHFSLDLKDSDFTFRVGDSIGILPRNDPILVQHLLNAMRAQGDEAVIDPKSGVTLTIREFLSGKANLSRLTSSFLKLLYAYEPLHDKKNQLNHLLQPEHKPLLAQYLEAHDPLDLLREYREAKAPLQELCAQFGPLLPRFYSVASSQCAYPDEVHLTVALFTFNHAGEQRFGVASHFLCHMADMETPIPIYVQPAHHFGLPENPATPIIMIGPGTGVAPFRAFVQERIAKGATGKNWLFFGERNRNSDFFYEEFWNSQVKNNNLRLDCAFSRDQPEKIYVQHRLYSHAEEIWKWIQEECFLYVCGDAHRMAKDVEATLHKIIEEQGKMSPEAAKLYLRALKSQKRYLLDVY